MKIILILLTGLLSFTNCSSQQDKHDLSPREFYDSIQSNSDIVLLDVRTPAEYSTGFIGNAVNIDFNDADFQARIANLDKNSRYYVYCLAGSRSTSAIKQLRKVGISNVAELGGGMLAWRKEGLPLVEMELINDKISRESYEHLISGKLVLVDFYASWCGPCRKVEPSLEEIGKKYGDRLTIVRINIDENKRLAGDLGVTEIPVLKLFVNGKELWDHRGFADKNTIEKAVGKGIKTH